jgi:tRNA (cmo5U34)-methyltransferase
MSTGESRDTLFHIDNVEEDFVFNNRVVEVFDDMVHRSIPFYDKVIEGSALLLDRYLADGETVYDLGCATGSSLIELSKMLKKKDLHFIGIDNSEPMLSKARLKTELFSCQDRVSFSLEDVTEFTHRGAGAILLNYTLQFIRPLLRARFLQQLFDALKPGGLLLISEKVINHDSRLNREYIDIYHQFKKTRGYSELEIAKKREALENVLIPFSIRENRQMLLANGFTPVETYFQWFNFSSIVAVKPG